MIFNSCVLFWQQNVDRRFQYFESTDRPGRFNLRRVRIFYYRWSWFGPMLRLFGAIISEFSSSWKLNRMFDRKLVKKNFTVISFQGPMIMWICLISPDSSLGILKYTKAQLLKIQFHVQVFVYCNIKKHFPVA